MTIQVLVAGQQSAIADTIEEFYLSPQNGKGTVITAFTASNDTGVNRSYKAYIYDALGVVLGPITPFKVVNRKKFDLGAAIVNQKIPAGGTLRMESSEATSILFYVTGDVL